MIKLQNIYKSYAHKEVLRSISLTVKDGEFVALVGESGSGKTTVLKIIAGLVEPNKGVVNVDEKIAMVFQGGALLPWLTVKENILAPTTFGAEKISKEDLEKALEEVGLKAMENKYPRDLSGGQRQRVGIARALAVKRKILLLDEPFSALDIKTAEELRNDLLRLWKANNLTVVMVSHLVEEAVYLADRVVVMEEGQIRREINIDLPRPHKEDSPMYRKYVEHIKDIIEN